jgi:hypothetical protein
LTVLARVLSPVSMFEIQPELTIMRPTCSNFAGWSLSKGGIMPQVAAVVKDRDRDRYERGILDTRLTQHNSHSTFHVPHLMAETTANESSSSSSTHTHTHTDAHTHDKRAHTRTHFRAHTGISIRIRTRTRNRFVFICTQTQQCVFVVCVRVVCACVFVLFVQAFGRVCA